VYLTLIAAISSWVSIRGREARAMPQIDRRYRDIVAHYEDCLARYGDNRLGIDWPRREDAELRYAVMLDLIHPDAPTPTRLLDFGCGAGHLLEFILRHRVSGIEYHGLDLSERYLALCRAKFPEVPFLHADVLEDGKLPSEFDYVVMNGVFTEKRELSFAAMWEYVQAVLRRIWPFVRRGLAFNVMSKQVDWERDDLFHLPCDTLMAFLKSELSRHCVVRHDYGLFEYTTYV
jgi:SAM-dependent methyltransferase